jgi:hypothetical protein
MALISLANIVDTYLPHLAKAVSERDKCLGCAHLIHRPGDRSICRAAKIVGDWPVPKADGAVITSCQEFLPRRG